MTYAKHAIMAQVCSKDCTSVHCTCITKRETPNLTPSLQGAVSGTVLSRFHVGTNEIHQCLIVCHLRNVRTRRKLCVGNAIELCNEQIWIEYPVVLARDVRTMLPHGLMRIRACQWLSTSCAFPTALPTHAWIPGQSRIPGEC